MDRFTDRARLYKSESERFQEYLKNLPDDAWSRQSACDEWLVGDVVAHLVGNAEFYAGTVARGTGLQPGFCGRGEPVEILFATPG